MGSIHVTICIYTEEKYHSTFMVLEDSLLGVGKKERHYETVAENINIQDISKRLTSLKYHYVLCKQK